jgi:ParB family transcriptional regulator, chromosome partitioning protein
VKHRGLGKGLSALIPERSTSPENQVQSIPLGQIKAGLYQPRHRFNHEQISELANSVKENGIVQPVIVRPVTSGYELVAGERRWRAAKMAGLTHIPALVRKMEDRKALESSLIENLQRADLNPIETAKGYQTLIAEFGLTQEAVSKVTAKNRATIANMLRLLKLPEQVKKMLEEETLSTGHAKALLSLKNQNQIVLFAEKTARLEWSVRDLEFQIAEFMDSNEKKQLKTPEDPNIEAVFNVLRKKYSTKIQHFPKKRGGGRIVLEYYSEGDLVRLLDLLGV